MRIFRVPIFRVMTTTVPRQVPPVPSRPWRLFGRRRNPPPTAPLADPPSLYPEIRNATESVQARAFRDAILVRMEQNGKLRLEEMKLMREMYQMGKDDHEKTRRKLEEQMNTLCQQKDDEAKEAKKAREETAKTMKEGFEDVKKSQNKISTAVVEGFEHVDDSFEHQKKHIEAFRDEIGHTVGDLTLNMHNLHEAAANCLEVHNRQIGLMLHWMKKSHQHFEVLNFRTRSLANDGGWGYIEYPRGRSGGPLDIPPVPRLLAGGTLARDMDEIETSKKGF